MKSGQELKQMGLDLVESHNVNFTERMRDYATRYCRVHKSVTSDDLRRYATSHDIEPDHKNAWGSIFRKPVWKAIGFEPSTLPSNHGRIIRRWALA
jgi:hypothetical protein